LLITFTMKKLLFIGFLLISVKAFAQIKGNASRESAGNVNYDKNVNYNSNYNAPTTKAPAYLPAATWLDDRTVVLEVNAISNQLASTYTVIFNIKQLGQTAEEADKLFNERYEAFVAAAMLAGIKRDEIYLDMISFVPVYEFEEEKKLFSKKTYNEIPKGFEIQQNVHIKYKDNRVLGKLVSAAAKSEIYDIVKVDYFVENTEEIYHDLRKRAIEFVNKEIIQFEILGVELDAAYRIAAEEERSTSPLDRYSSYKAFTSQSLDGTAKGKVNSADKAVTMYYEKIAYDEFEIIVNPTILEPTVQYMYNLKVKFRLKQPEPTIEVKREKEFVWLTPAGDLKTLEIKKEDTPLTKPNNGTTTVIPDK
jgi:uncharacterized protein YggE